METRHGYELSFEEFLAPKAGMDDDTIEDAIHSRLDEDRFVVAIADGATQAFASGRWASMLASHFVERPQLSRISPTWLTPVAATYRQSVDFAALPWYAQEKASRGSFATLLGLQVDLKGRSYRAIAVGDSCLAIVDQTRPRPRLTIFPKQLATPGSFTNNPYLVGSSPAFNTRLTEMQSVLRPRALPDRGTFFLMTDALAAWFIEAHARKELPWRLLSDLHSREAFLHTVDTLRAAGQLRDDDTSLFELRVERGDVCQPPPIPH